MTRGASLFWCAGGRVIAVAGGCSSSSLQGNADGWRAVRRARCAGPAVVYWSRRLIVSQGGQPFSRAAHVFTLIVDADTQTAIVGADGSGDVVPFDRTSADTISITGPDQLRLRL